MTLTTAREVVSLFGTTLPGSSALRRWESNQKYIEAGVIPAVYAHSVEKAYTLGFKSVAQVCADTHKQHALGNLRTDKPLQDWNTPFTMAYIMHHGIEEYGYLPGWNDFSNFFLNTPEGIRLLGADFHRVTRGIPELVNAATFRIGKQYYSFLREMYTVTWLRDVAGFDVRIHPLADAVFRVDAWCDGVALAIWMPNSKYRDGAAGRKTPAAEFLKGSGFRVCDLTVEIPSAFGRVALPTEEALANAAAALNKAIKD